MTTMDRTQDVSPYNCASPGCSEEAMSREGAEHHGEQSGHRSVRLTIRIEHLPLCPWWQSIQKQQP